ncbi:MAG: ABC transporter ATP-binding protein, partial [Halobacteriota archaeon]
MDDEIAIKAEHVSKKFCKNLRRSMQYGIKDIGRNTVGLKSHGSELRAEEFWSFDDVSFEVRLGETLGIIGPNGAGKTTMLKLLNGILWPDKGKISIRGKMGVLIDVGAGFHPMLTGRENISINAAILGMSKQELQENVDSILEFADIGSFIDTPVKHYSSGMLVRLGFAIAVHCDPDILLVDEVLAVGDEGFQIKCFNKIGELKKRGTTVVLVSHNMYLVSAYATRILLLNDASATYYEQAEAGIRAYNDLFMSGDGFGVEKKASGNDEIQFIDVQVEKRVFRPGEPLRLAILYESSRDYPDIFVDLAIYTSRDATEYFQATNKMFSKTIDLLKGKHKFKISVAHVPINNAIAKISVTIADKQGPEVLLWWVIPVEFAGV